VHKLKTATAAVLCVTDRAGVHYIDGRLSPVHTTLWTLRPNSQTQPRS